jgi:hypothetical protein
MMGLTIGVGWHSRDKQELDADEFDDFSEPYRVLSRELVGAGLPPHVEPVDFPEPEIFEAEMIGYGGLHYIRRLAAYWVLTEKLPSPDIEYEHAIQDPMIERLYDKLAKNDYRSRPQGLWDRITGKHEELFAHLMLHSDAEGFYVPTEFEDVIFEQGTDTGLGGMIGSSQKLLQECEILAKLIELPPDIDCEDETLWDVSEDPEPEGPLWHQYGKEAFGLARLITACRVSIRNKAVVVFG